MRCRAPPEIAHRAALLRPPDKSARKRAALEITEPAKAIPVGHFLAGFDATPDPQPGCPHPFGDTAVRLHDLGLVVFPCGGPSGKKPLVKKWQVPRPRSVIATWAQTFAEANIGVVCGLSGIVVVDVDRPDLVEELLERLGNTPLITRTPGGVHLLYRKVGDVRSRNLRKQGLKVDIKADGGQVLVPPSRNPKGVYVFEHGSWDDLQGLPPFSEEALEAVLAEIGSSPSPPRAQPDLTGVVNEGARNDALFWYLMGMARYVDGWDALIAVARSFNGDHLFPSLLDAEVVKTARSVWRYQSEGRIWFGSRGHVSWSVERVQTCAPHKHGGDAVVLMTVLRVKHAKRKGPFAVVPRAMADHQVVAGWSEHRTRAALAAAVELELIVPVHKGRRYPGDPSLYRLPSFV